MKVNAVLLQKGVNLHTSLKTQHLAKVRFGQPLRTVAFESQSLQGNPSRILTFRGDLARYLVRDTQGDFHMARIAHVLGAMSRRGRLR